MDFRRSIAEIHDSTGDREVEEMNTAILIPAYEPDDKLINLVQELSNMQFPIILVVNDGSSEKCEGIFNTLKGITGCTVVSHGTNKGKGAALKTGMQAIFRIDPNISGCVTVDADGQHLPEDILRTAVFFERHSNTLVLGCRDFSAKNVPAKSRFGNLLTRTIFRLSTGRAVTDTQTGLRAIPAGLMDIFTTLPGDHYEFEMNMLMHAAKCNIPIEEVSIRTVYINRNKASHFNPLLDSIRIYKEILKFSFSSLISSGIDLGVFSFVYWLLSSNDLPWSLLGATVVARLLSSAVNFTLNRRVVFRNREPLFLQAIKYYLLCIVQMFCSWMLLEMFTLLGFKYIVLLKMLVDTLLFLVGYGIQRLYIFGRRISYEKNA